MLHNRLARARLAALGYIVCSAAGLAFKAHGEWISRFPLMPLVGRGLTWGRRVTRARLRWVYGEDGIERKGIIHGSKWPSMNHCASDKGESCRAVMFVNFSAYAPVLWTWYKRCKQVNSNWLAFLPSETCRAVILFSRICSCIMQLL